MKIYHYNSESKVYTGVSDARESPLEPGVFLIPGFATKIKPPALAPGKEAVFKNDQWILQDIKLEEVQKRPSIINIRQEVQAMLDGQAQSMDFESILEAMTYAEESAVPKYQEQAKQLRTWRSLVWAKYDEVMEDFKSKGIAEPIPAQVIEQLPKFKDIAEVPGEQ